jgi:mannosyltransferase OCH1-like enzyme
MVIPKITHQIWMQGWDKVPEKYRENTESVRIFNPNWEHMTWDEESLRAECEKFSPEAAAKFDSYPHMVRKVDFGRVVVLYNYGGISIDCDAECLRPLEKIPGINTDEFIISKWSKRSNFESKLCHRGLGDGLIMFNNATFACTKNHPIMKQFIEFLIENNNSSEDMNFDEEVRTGPTVTSIFFNHYLDDITILDPEIIEPWGDITKRTVINHKYACSWMHPILQFINPYYLNIRNNFFSIVVALHWVIIALIIFKPKLGW